MRWKALLTIIIILACVGFLLTTEIGKKYFGFLENKVGEFVSILLRRGQPSGKVFKIVLNSNKEPFYGQSYSLKDTTFSCSGVFRQIKIGNQVITLKKDKEISITIRDINGQFEITKGGDIRVSGDSNYLEIDDYIFSATNPARIEVDVLPTTAHTTVLEQKISVASVTGEIKRLYNGREDKVSLTNSKLDIDNFSGSFSFSDGIVLEGTANSVIGDKFSFT